MKNSKKKEQRSKEEMSYEKNKMTDINPTI